MKILTNAEKVAEFLSNPNAELFKKFVAVHECILDSPYDEKIKSVFKFSESTIETMRMMNDSDCVQTFLLYHRQGGMTPRGEKLLKEKEDVEKHE